MALIDEGVLPDFPGFSFEYDLEQNPFFKSILIENLRKLKSVPVGEDLLEQIADARPRSRGNFWSGVNVKCAPTFVRFAHAGLKLRRGWDDNGSEFLAGVDKVPGCPSAIYGGSANEAVDQEAAENGAGT